MVVIRLARSGGRKRPFYHIHVADQRRSRDGRFIERLGFYDPLPRIPKEAEARDAQQHIPERVRIDLERLDYWVRQGAQMSARVKKVVRDYKKAPEDKGPVAAEDTAAEAPEETIEDTTAETAAETPEETTEATTAETPEDTPEVAETTAAPTDDEEVAA